MFSRRLRFQRSEFDRYRPINGRYAPGQSWRRMESARANATGDQPTASSPKFNAPNKGAAEYVKIAVAMATEISSAAR